MKSDFLTELKSGWDLFLEELRKIMRKRYGYLFLFGMVLVKLLFGFFVAGDSYDTDFFIEKNKESFLRYEKEFGGKLTKKNQKKIQALIKEQERANEFLLEQGRLLTEGTITMQEYLERSEKERKILQEREIAGRVKEQYQYVKADRERRFFLYPNGWVNFFQKAGTDFFCFFCIAFLTTAVFGREFEMEMHAMNRVCACGGKRLYGIKWCTALAVAVLFSIASYLAELITAAGRYGLGNGFCPLQSISLFEDCPWEISLMEAAVLVLCLKIGGAVLFTSLLQLCCLFLQKTVPCIVTAVLLTALPYFFLPKSVLYHIPAPTPFFLMNGFLEGTYNIDTGHRDFLMKKDMLFLAGQGLLLTACFVFAGYYCYQRGSAKKYRGKRLSIRFFCVCFLLPLLAFCQCGKWEETPVLYQYQMNPVFENSKEIFITCKYPFIRKEKESGKEEPLILDVFWEKEDYEMVRIIYVTEKDIYYIKYDGLNQYDLVRFDLERMTGHVIYRYQYSGAKGYHYLGILPEPNFTAYYREKQQRERTDSFWADGNYLYLVKGENVEQWNRTNGKKKTIIKNTEGNVAYYDGKIYYLSADYLLHCYCIEDGTTEVWEEYPLQDFKLLKEKIVFFTLDEKIGYCSHSWEKTKVFENDYGTLLDATEQYFYCQGKEGTVIAVNYQGEQEKEHSFSNPPAMFASGEKDDWFCGIVREASGELNPVYGVWE